MKKPVYLYVTPFFPSQNSWRGGYCLDAAKAIARDGRYDVCVMVTGDGDDYEWDGIRVARFRRLNAPSGVIPFLLNWLNNRLFKKKLDELGIITSKVSVCHVNTLAFGQYAAYFKRLNPNTNAIIQLHSCYSLHLDSGRLGLIPLHATLLYIYYRHMCISVDRLIFVSKMSMETFGKIYVREPEGERKDIRSLLLIGKILPPLKLPKKTVVYNGIDTTLFSSSGRVSHKGFMIGCVANFQPLKAHMTLLEAIYIIKDEIPDIKVRLVGSGKTLKDCKKYASDHALENIVSFENEVDHRAIADFYRSLDLFVLPSRLEGFLCVCVESWACGTQSIFCENIGLAELVPEEERNKWLFKPLDTIDLANKIQSYYKNKWLQHFKINLEINSIWKEFLDKLEKK